ncbi:E3 ubiquitin-protein ligase Rnf220-like isoform X2 [Amblyomma americanum]
MSADDATTAVDGPAPSDGPAAADASPEAASTSMSPSADESADIDAYVDDGCSRQLRPKRRNASSTAFGCPVCGVTLRPHELQQHWQLEVDRLHGIARNVARRQRSDSSSGRCVNGISRRREQSVSRVRSNRQRRRRGPSSCVSCPVCHRALEGSPDELAEHVDRCLARAPNDDSMDEEVDVDVTGSGEGGAETFDEYEWAGQSRLRATALLEGGYRAAGWFIGGSSSIACRSSNNANDDDADLDVDGDDADTFGRPQFSEADLIPLDSGEPCEERERLLRQAVLLNQDGVGRSSASPRRDEDSTSEEKPDSPVEKPSLNSDAGAEAVTTNLDLPKGATAHVLNSLRERLRQLEEQNSAATRCLICMEPYTQPVVSVCCWHVHCQDCWLRTLGAKKLCPQCNSITGASDLRRIYL